LKCSGFIFRFLELFLEVAHVEIRIFLPENRENRDRRRFLTLLPTWFARRFFVDALVDPVLVAAPDTS
jgi:hypothetical protein